MTYRSAKRFLRLSKPSPKVTPPTHCPVCRHSTVLLSSPIFLIFLSSTGKQSYKVIYADFNAPSVLLLSPASSPLCYTFCCCVGMLRYVVARTTLLPLCSPKLYMCPRPDLHTRAHVLWPCMADWDGHPRYPNSHRRAVPFKYCLLSQSSTWSVFATFKVTDVLLLTSGVHGFISTIKLTQTFRFFSNARIGSPRVSFSAIT